MHSKGEVIRSHQNLNELDVSYSSTKVYRKYSDDALEINVYHYSKNSQMCIYGSKTDQAWKTYYVVKGKCKHLETGSVLEVGDILKIGTLSEVGNIYMLEDTTLLIHAYNFTTFDIIGKNTQTIVEVLKTIQTKDAYTEAHCGRVFELTQKMALACGYTGNKMYNLLRAARYHDIGKIFIESEILTKPARLSPYEYERMKQHVSLGKEMIVDEFGDEIFAIVSQHHERIDGSGYPLGLKENAISEGGRILAICDSYDAMVTNRVYQQAKPKEAALKELQHLAGQKYDAALVRLFVQIMSEEDTY